MVDIDKLKPGHRVALDDPDRDDIIFLITGRLPAGANAKAANRLGNVAEATVVDGHRFPSKKEAARYSELKLGEAAGIIRGLELQKRYPLIVNGVPVFKRGYYADFVYEEKDRSGQWKQVVEDAKGFETETFQIKARLMLALYGIEVRRT